MDDDDLECALVHVQCWHLLLTMWLLYQKVKQKRRKCRIRRWWVCPINYLREEQGTYANLSQEMIRTDHEQFFEYTRMTVPQYYSLCDMVAPFLRKRSIRTPLPVEMRVAITLEVLARGTSFRTAAWDYRIGRSTVYKVVRETCVAIWKALQPTFIPTPTREHLQRVADKFMEKWQFPNCVGAIDGKHIQIPAPPLSGSQFYNYKNFFSVVLLGVCDADYRFLWVDVGDYGSISDGGVWSNCALAQALERGEVELPPPSPLPGEMNPMPYALVGDEAFPLKTFMMRPYARRAVNLSDEDKIFNYRLSRARRTIENVFGIAAARWRILRTSICCLPEFVDDIAKAVACLHNYLMTGEEEVQPVERRYCPSSMLDRYGPDGQEIQGDWRNEAGTGAVQEIGRLGANNPTRAADAQRNALREYFVSDVGQVPWQWAIAFQGHQVNPPR